MAKTGIADARYEGTGYSYTMSLIQGKHKMVILYCLMEYQPVRFNEMRRYLGKVTDRTLSTSLKELEADGLIVRREYPQVPPKVEYALTPLGGVTHAGARPALRVERGAQAAGVTHPPWKALA